MRGFGHAGVWDMNKATKKLYLLLMGDYNTRYCVESHYPEIVVVYAQEYGQKYNTTVEYVIDLAKGRYDLRFREGSHECSC